MKCQLKYRWVKLPRACLPQGKGVLGQWARLAARAAYRKGVGLYCGFENPVEPGMWAGGVVGLKSILGTRSRKAALETLEQLRELGYLSYSLDLSLIHIWLPGYCAGSMPSRLARAVTNIPRVIGASGSKVVALVPESTPDPAAHCTWG